MANQYHQFKLVRLTNPEEKADTISRLREADTKVIITVSECDIVSNFGLYCIKHNKPLLVRALDKSKYAIMVPHEGKTWTILLQRGQGTSYFCNADKLSCSIGFPFELLAMSLSDDYLQKAKQEAKDWLNSISASVLKYWLKSEGEPDWRVAVRHEDIVAVKWLWKQGYLTREALEARLGFSRFFRKLLP